LDPIHQDVKRLQPEQKLEYNQDVRESNRRYNRAFSTVLSHTTDAELEAFWKPFAGDSSSAAFSRDIFFQPSQLSGSPGAALSESAADTSAQGVQWRHTSSASIDETGSADVMFANPMMAGRLTTQNEPQAMEEVAVDAATSSVGTELVDSIVVVDEDFEDEDEGGVGGGLATVPTPWKRSDESTGLKSIHSQASV
jgi:hypothetical protein